MDKVQTKKIISVGYTASVHLQDESCNKYRNGIIYLYIYILATLWYIRLWFCNAGSSPSRWKRMYQRVPYM
jgi:hypothetical protein